MAARGGGPGDPAAHQRGPLPPPAGARRGPPVRHHPPPLAPLQVDGREHARRRARASARCAARRCSSTSARSRSCARPRPTRSRWCPASGRAPPPRSRRRSRAPTRPARLPHQPVRVNTATGEIIEEDSVTDGGPDRRRARHRHRHDRRRPQHRRQGAGGPRLLRGRQPAAHAGARRRPPRRRQPRGPPADRRRGRRPLRLVLRLPAGQPAPGRHRPADHAALPRGHRRRPRPPTGGRPPPAPAAGRAAGCSHGLQREREVLGRAARRRRRRDRHHQLQRPPAHRPDRRAVRQRRVDRAQGDRDQLRLQVRHPGRRRLRGRHALPAQPVLGARAASANGRDEAVADYVKSPAECRDVPRPVRPDAGDRRRRLPHARASAS